MSGRRNKKVLVEEQEVGSIPPKVRTDMFGNVASWLFDDGFSLREVRKCKSVR